MKLEYTLISKVCFERLVQFKKHLLKNLPKKKKKEKEKVHKSCMEIISKKYQNYIQNISIIYQKCVKFALKLYQNYIKII